MPVSLPAQHPALTSLSTEGITARAYDHKSPAQPQALRIGIVNLMPNVIETETQYARALSHADQSVELQFFSPPARLQEAYAYLKAPLANDNADRAEKSLHRTRYHTPFTDIMQGRAKLDAIIVSGFANEDAPLRQASNPSQGIDFYDDFVHLLRWAERTKTPVMTTCWSAQAALHALHGVSRSVQPQKITGAFNMNVENRDNALMRNFQAQFPMPTSRYAQSSESDIRAAERRGVLHVLADNETTGASIITQSQGPHIFMTGHLEYLADTLQKEYIRDLGKMGAAAPRPQNYNVESPERTWAAANAQFFKNLARHFEGQKQERKNALRITAPGAQGPLAF